MSEENFEETVDEIDAEEQEEPLPQPIISWPPFGEDVLDGDNKLIYSWDFTNKILLHYLEDGTNESRPFTDEELLLLPAVEAQNTVEATREVDRAKIKAIVSDLQAEKARVDIVIAKTNSTITGADTKDVARASKRIADAAIELARFVQNI